MNSKDSIVNPVVFLDKIARSYPYGVARQAIRRVTTDASNGYASDCALIMVGGQTALSPSEQTLLDGIITKGLKLSIDRCAVCQLDSTKVVGQELESLVRDLKARVVVVLGSPAAPGSRQLVGEVPVLHTYALARIGGEVAIKREFWSHLQGILPNVLGA
jgi:hypothetical protein